MPAVPGDSGGSVFYASQAYGVLAYGSNTF